VVRAAECYPPALTWSGLPGFPEYMDFRLSVDRGHTPKSAVFGIDPDYMLLPGEDQHGFRAVAERSVLADEVKDSGAVSLFPQLASHWKDQVRAESGWETFHLCGFREPGRPLPGHLDSHPSPGRAA